MILTDTKLSGSAFQAVSSLQNEIGSPASQNMAKHFNNACQCIESFLGEVTGLECCLAFGGQS